MRGISVLGRTYEKRAGPYGAHLVHCLAYFRCRRGDNGHGLLLSAAGFTLDEPTLRHDGVLAILIAGLFVVGAFGLAGYLLATIRTRERKTKAMLVSGHIFNLLQEKCPDLSGNIVVAVFVFIR